MARTGQTGGDTQRARVALLRFADNSGGAEERLGFAINHFSAGARPPAKPAQGVADGMDFAAFALVNGLDGNEFDGKTCGDKGEQGFGFNLEMRGVNAQAGPRAEPDEA